MNALIAALFIIVFTKIDLHLLFSSLLCSLFCAM